MSDKIINDDKLLNLSVVGEFSSGKSTFINAMLHSNLLSVSPRPGTTKAFTIIEYENWFGIILQYDNGEKKTHKFNSFNSLKKGLENFTTSPNVTCELESVRVFLPSEHLAKGFRIIDTPGSNNIMWWHNEATVRKLLDLSDASIILIDALTALPNSQRQFIFDNLKDILHRCVFVITKMDRMLKNEWEILLPYVSSKLKNDFGLESPTVLPFSSTKVMDYFENQQQSEFAQTSLKSETMILSWMDKLHTPLHMPDKIINDENFFSLNNIREIADFDEHLAFSEKILNKYKWEQSARNKITSLLQQIKSKQDDKLLNLSVIGEFSSGKSTFINAMLRYELLTSSALQGTTVASTIIEYGNRFGIVLQYDNGEKKTNKFDSFASLKKSLEKFTTNPDIARRLENVRVILPSEHLAKGFRVIDTPGTNATERWHEDVTVKTLRDISDVSIILVDAIKPLPESLCHFIFSNLEDILHQCVFVVTKMDVLREKEREQMLTYIGLKLKNTFGLDSPAVLPYSSTCVIDCFENQQQSELAQTSFKSEAEMFSRMAKLRASLQAKKLISLIDYMYGYIGKEIGSISKNSEDELKRLMRSRQADLSSFISTQKRERTAAFNIAVKDKHADIVNEFYKLSAQAQQNIINKIRSYDTIDAMKGFVNSELTNTCSAEADAITRSIEINGKQIYDCFQDQMTCFGDNFKELFKNLDILQVDFSGENLDIQQSALSTTTDLSEINAYLESQSKSENFFSVGGFASGAIVGTMIMPGIGTAIGTLVGALIGSAAGPKIEKVREDAILKLQIPIKNYFDRVVNESITTLNAYINSTSSEISKEIDKYLSKYNSIVEKKIKEEKRQQNEVEKKIDNIRKDMKDIENRKFRLSSISEHINSLT